MENKVSDGDVNHSTKRVLPGSIRCFLCQPIQFETGHNLSHENEWAAACGEEGWMNESEFGTVKDIIFPS